MEANTEQDYGAVSQNSSHGEFWDARQEMPYAAVTVLLPVQPALLLARSSWGVTHQSSIFCSNSLQCFVSLCELLSTGKLLPVWTGFYETVKSKRPNFVSTQLEVMHHLGQIAWEGVLAPCNLELISCVHKHYVSLAPFSHYSTFLEQRSSFLSPEQKTCIERLWTNPNPQAPIPCAAWGRKK